MRGPQIHPEVQAALDAGRPLVALESTIISHGLPRPDNLRVARELEQTVRDGGAVPATVAVMAGQVRIGVDPEGLRAIATRDDVTKVSARDLPAVVAHRGYGATTVAATAHLAARAGIRIFATGGLGGVHREARETWDESADLITLARTPIAVVCSGVKSTLDVAATLERLETLGVTVVGYRTTAFPGFYLSDSGCILDWRVDSSEQVAEVLRARDALGLAGAVVIANPLPTDQQLDPTLHDHVVRDALSAAAATGVRGKAVTPYVLDRVHRDTQAASLAANIRLVLRNAELAAAIAVAVAANRPTIRT